MGSIDDSPKEIIGDYVLEERIGGGEHSATFRGIHKITQEIAAVKVFTKSKSLSRNLYDAEIKAYNALRGLPGILRLIHHGENDEFCFIITEFIQEGTLRHILKDYPDGVNVEDALQIFTPVAEAIDRIHEKSIVHRDLKPENILIHRAERDYEIFITDFGAVKFTTDAQQFQTEHTTGTSWYIAPEALYADPSIPQTKAIDIYGLGVMLYEALEGKMPFSHATGVLDSDARPPDRVKQKTNANVAKYLLKPLNKDPELRPKSARELIRGIRNAYEGNLSTDQKWEGREFKNYVVEKVLGSGNMGVTLRARDKRTNKQVVLKAFEYTPFGNPLQAFNNEIKSLERLENGHGVLTPQDSFEEDSIFFIVTDYQSGGSLRQLLNRKPKSLTIKEILEIFTQLAETIDYIHENKIIHRDIKPENVVCNADDGKLNAFLTDFGISIILESAKSSFQTQHGAGTYRYMAPELWKPKAKKTKAVDIYSFGIMLYEALEGNVPFDAEHPAIINQHLSIDPPPPKNTLKELGVDAQNILLQALAKNAEERPKTATEIIQQIKGQYTKFLGKEFGKYTTDKFIGQGPYGVTYRAHDTDHKRKKFALKILSVSHPNMREINRLKELPRLSGVLPILEGDGEDDIHYIVTEYLNGNSLRDMLQDYTQGMGLEETLRIFKPVAKALDSLHNAGICHGDLKPENIVFHKNKSDDNFPQPLITDYGISKVIGKAQALHSKGNIPGNFEYMAPELWEEKEPSFASDVYALGVMLYEAVEGGLPFTAKSFAGIMRQHLNESPPTPKNLFRQGGERAVSVLLRSLHKNPERRPGSAEELIFELEQAARYKTSTATGPITGPLMKSFRTIRSAGKKKLEISVSRLAGIIAIAIFALVFYFIAPRTLFFFIPVTGGTPTVTSTETTFGPTSTPPTATEQIPATVTPTIPSLPPCELQRRPVQTECYYEYTSEDPGSLEKLYSQFYGNKSSKIDLDAIAYYNNRKALEEASYHFIEPRILEVEKGWRIFFPPLDSIKKYKDFPVPVLEEMDEVYTNSKITISGSSALYPLSSKIAEGFEKATKLQEVEITANNTKLGLSDFCQGRADIFGVTEGNLEGCPKVNFLRFEIARYAVVIFIGENNPYQDELREHPPTREELVRLLTNAETWKDVREDLGNEPIKRFYPSLDSGAFEIIRNTIFPTADIAKISGLEEIEEEDSIPGKVINDSYSIGFSGYVNYQKNNRSLIAIPVNRVPPNLDTIKGENPTYPLTRQLYLYTGKVTYQENALLRSFINYYLAYEFDYLDELGYFYPTRNGFLDNPYTTP